MRNALHQFEKDGRRERDAIARVMSDDPAQVLFALAPLGN